MLYIFLSGVAGFWVFDAYRIRKFYDENRVVALTVGSPLGILIHFAVWFAAGIAAVMINLDVIAWLFHLQVFPTDLHGIEGPALRGFALGLAGPAAISTTGSSKAGPNTKIRGAPVRGGVVASEVKAAELKGKIDAIIATDFGRVGDSNDFSGGEIDNFSGHQSLGSKIIDILDILLMRKH